MLEVKQPEWTYHDLSMHISRRNNVTIGDGEIETSYKRCYFTQFSQNLFNFFLSALYTESGIVPDTRYNNIIVYLSASCVCIGEWCAYEHNTISVGTNTDNRKK